MTYAPGQLRGKKGGLFQRLGRAPTRELTQALRPPDPRAAELIYRKWVRAFWRMWGELVLAELDTQHPDFTGQFRRLLASSNLPGTLNRVAEAVRVLVAGYMRSLFKPGVLPKGVRQDAGQSVTRVRAFQNAEQEAAIDAWRLESLALISNAGAEHIAQLESVFKAAQEAGLPHADLIAQIKKRLGVGESRARLIASDQTTKFNGSVQAVQQQAAGITEFVWSTSHDGVVRPTHRLLDGRTFSWAQGAPDGPNEHAFPGQPIRCRCQPIPKIALFEGLD